MRRKLQILSLLFSILLTCIFISTSIAEDDVPHKANITYAKGFTIEYHDTYKIVTVMIPGKNADMTFQYVLVQRGTELPSGYDNTQYVEIPVRSLVTMSTTYLPHLDQLDLLDILVGHDNFKHVNTPAVRELIAKGKIKETGEGPNINIELLLELNPELIMTHGSSSMYDAHPKFFEAGLPVVINGAYMEPAPLARTEWIKFIAAFFNKEQEAEHVFNEIAKAYEKIAVKARKAGKKPTVLLNAPYKDKWWVPGGKSSVAKLMEDAGAEYVWTDDPSTGSHPVDLEVVYERASEAEYWVNTGRWNSLRDGLAVDERFGQFKAFREGRVYNRNARVNEYGGNDYWESGLSRPDVVLKDLIKIFHPELLPDHELVYYKQLKIED